MAACLSLLFWEQSNRPAQSSAQPAGEGGRTASLVSVLYSYALVCGLAASVVLLARLIGRVNGWTGIVNFLVPIAAIAVVLVRNEIAGRRAPGLPRIREHWRLLLPVTLGFSLVVGVFLMPYVLSGSVGDLTHGLFVRPVKRLDVTPDLPPWLSWIVLPAVIIVARTWRWSTNLVRGIGPALVVFLAWVVWRGSALPYYPGVILTIRAIVPAAVVGVSVGYCWASGPCMRRLQRRRAEQRSLTQMTCEDHAWSSCSSPSWRGAL